MAQVCRNTRMGESLPLRWALRDRVSGMTQKDLEAEMTERGWLTADRRVTLAAPRPQEG